MCLCLGQSRPKGAKLKARKIKDALAKVQEIFVNDSVEVGLFNAQNQLMYVKPPPIIFSASHSTAVDFDHNEWDESGRQDVHNLMKTVATFGMGGVLVVGD